jgi:acetate kinase
MNVLVFNCGSSSLKYKLLTMPAAEEAAGGEAQRVGPPTAKPSVILHHEGTARETHEVPMPDHGSAFEQVMRLLGRRSHLVPDAVGHRVVHGGDRFARPARVTAAVLDELASFSSIAPLHNPPAIALMKACQERYTALPQVAVFDTAFHATIPEYARTYALPIRLREEFGFRKYGFHGTSHQFVAEEAAEFLKIQLARFNAVSCHLGSGGASLCAVVRGRSVDNTMGYSPLQGLVMSTRCGDLDPAITLQLLASSNGDGAVVDKLLNSRSGVLGLSGRSADVRDVVAETSSESLWDSRTDRTLQVYLWRIRKYLGAYLAIVGQPDAVIFTDTIGETVPYVRRVLCAGMEAFGLRIDARRNVEVSRYPADVAQPGSAVRILVVQTNEELAIARQTDRALRSNYAEAGAPAAGQDNREIGRIQ